MSFETSLSSVTSLLPHGQCYFWKPDLLWLHVTSDAVISASYYSIPLALLTLVKQRRDLIYRWLFVCFSLFILACGTTHLMSIYTVWEPSYYAEGAVKVFTALISAATAVALWPLLPEFLTLPSHKDLEEKKSELLMANQEIQMLQDENIELSESKYRAIVETISDIVWTTDPDGAFSRQQPSWERYTGQSFQQYQKFGWVEAIHPDDREHIERTWAEAVQNQKTYLAEGRIWSAQHQQYRYFVVNGTPIITTGGQVREWIGVVRDIHIKHQAENQFRAVVEAAPNGMILVNQAGDIVFINSEGEKMFGYDRSELVGLSIDTLVPHRFRGEHPKNREYFFSAPRTRAMGAGRDLFGLRKGGREFPVEIGLNPIEAEDGLFVLSSVVDITQRKEAEERLRRFADELKRSNTELEQFAYVASHDLKAPLRAIKNIGAWIEEDLVDGRTDEVLQHLNKLKGRVSRMSDLLDSLLEYSRVGRIKHQREKINFRELIDDVIQLLDPPKLFRFVMEGDFPVFVGEKAPLELVLRNLVQNALKHHDKPDGTIEIHGNAADGILVIGVIDDGPGIPEVFHERIFQMFQTLRPRDEVEGTGMGLALVKKTVESVGGKITVNSAVGKGTNFTFTWPLSP